MRDLTPSEQRTIRYAAIFIAAYLLLFFGSGWFKGAGSQRAQYRQLQAQARDLRERVRPYADKIEVTRKLMASFRLDPMTLDPATLVAKSSAAIQKASSDAGMEAGPIHESLTHGEGREAASIRFETSGPVPAALAFLHQLQSTGYPLVIDSVQCGPDNKRPGALKLNLTILVLDFEQWKKEEAPNA